MRAPGGMKENMSQRYVFEEGRVHVHEAWTVGEVKAAVESILDDFADRLPDNPEARVVIKPNLNNDLVALTGNCTDLRVIGSLIEGLLNRGYRNLLLADGSNVGVDRRGIDSFRRLRVDRLASRYGIDLLDLNKDEGRPIALHGGAIPKVADSILMADCLISVPTIKTHVEAGLSCAMKNWVGIVRGQDKRQVHYDLNRNIFALNEAVLPDLIVVDGLVGMEGNGPGDGEPFRLGRILGSDSTFVNDVAVCRMMDLSLEEVPYLVCAREAGHVSDALLEAVDQQVEVIRAIKPAPPRPRVAELAEARSLRWLKRVVTPALNQERVLEFAYRFGVIQDVYSLEDDTVAGVRRGAGECEDCSKCEDFCPTHLKAEEIGVKTDEEDCIRCMYCWWVCPKGIIEIEGDLLGMSRQVKRYKEEVEAL